MSSIENQVEFQREQDLQWEVSTFDVAQTPVYEEWVKKHDGGMSSEIAEQIANDPSNIHFAFSRPPKKVLLEALHSLGMCIRNPSECIRQLCRHKTFGGSVVFGERYVGLQRTDEEWERFIKTIKGQ